MKKIMLLIGIPLILVGCDSADELIKTDFVVENITQDFCLEDDCVYTVGGHSKENLFYKEFKCDSDMFKKLEVDQKIKFKYNENKFIEELIIN